MANRITTLFSFKEEGGGLSKVRKDVQDTDGVINKFKVGAKSSFAEFRTSAAQGAAVAGGALVAFGATAVKQFTDTAIAAGTFADSTDMSVESSSRWLDVVSRYGVELNDLSDVFNNVADKVAQGDDVFDDLGVTIARTESGAVDMNETMVRVIEAMEGVHDPAERARIAAELFGEEGSRQFAELVAKGGDLRDMLNDVADAKIIDDGEVAKAREAREDMKRLTDSLSELALEVGEAVLPAVDLLADSMEGLNAIISALKIDQLLGWLADLDVSAERVGRSIRSMFDQSSADNWEFVDMFDEARRVAMEFDDELLKNVDTFGEAREIALEWAEAQGLGAAAATDAANVIALEFNEALEKSREEQEASEKAALLATEAMRDEAKAADHTATVLGGLERDTEDAADEAERLAGKTDMVRESMRRFQAQLDDRRTYLELKGDAAAYVEELENIQEELENEAIDHDEAARRAELARIDMTKALTEYADELDNLPKNIQTEIEAAVKSEDVDEVERVLEWITRTRRLQIGISTFVESDPNQVIRPGQVGMYHSGGIVGKGMSGTSSDEVLALLQKGEGVVDKPTMDAAKRGGGLGGGGGVTIETHIHGSVYGVDDLERRLNERDRKMEAKMRAAGMGWF